MTLTAQTPWKLEVDADHQVHETKLTLWISAGSTLVAKYETNCDEYADGPSACAANAQFIVEACNNHEALVAALTDLIEDIERHNVNLPSYEKAKKALAMVEIK